MAHTPVFEPYVGYVWSQPVFPALHTPGHHHLLPYAAAGAAFWTQDHLWFWLSLCSCSRDRRFSLSSLYLAWRLGLAPASYQMALFHMVPGGIGRHPIPAQYLDHNLVGLFAWLWGSPILVRFSLSPLPANRFYCRYLCPYGSTFGLLNHAGFYSIKNGHPTMHRLPALRTGMRHGHPGMEARQDER